MLISDAILLGAGLGTRYAETTHTPNKELPKQFQLLGNVPVFIHALKSLLEMKVLRQVLFVVPKRYMGIAKEQIDTYLPDTQGIAIRIIEGGARRQDSSRIAIEALQGSNPPPTRILIHDACRPFLSADLTANIKTTLADRSYAAWIPVVPVVETLKRVENKQVVETVDRSLVHKVQTPQIFEFSVIHSLMDRIKDLTELNFTDDAALCEYYGIPVGVFRGDVRNIKLTYEFEMETLRLIMAEAKVPKCESESATTFTV